MAVKKHIPTIRFKGFSDEWEKVELRDVSTYSNGGSFENDVQENGRYELITLKSINMQGILVSSGKYIDIETPTLKKDTLVMILSEQSPGLLGMTAQIPLDNRYVLNQRVAEIRPNKDIFSYFLSMAINKNQHYFSRSGAGTKVQNISKPNVEGYEFSCPRKKEQTQIGSYFQNLDKLISLHQAKVNKLVNLKKAMLEKMLPKNCADVPEIRFKGFEGAWEERPFGETFAYISNNTLSRAQLNYDFGLAKNVHYGDVLIKFGELLDAEKEDLPFITDDDLARKYKVAQLQNGDVIIADAAEDESVGKCSEVINVGNQIIVAGLHIIAIRPIQFFAPKYLGYFMNSVAYQKQLLRLMQGTKVLSISKSAIKDTSVLYPSDSKEQEKIGTYFQNLDQLIKLNQSELDKLNNLKNACLEKMFV